MVKLASVCDLNTSKTEIHDTPDDLLVSFIDMASVSSEGFIERKVDRPYGEVRNGGYTYFAEGDFIIAKITPCMKNGKCAIAEGLTNGIGFGSSEFHTNCFTKQCAYVFRRRRRISTLRGTNLEGADSCN